MADEDSSCWHVFVPNVLTHEPKENGQRFLSTFTTSLRVVKPGLDVAVQPRWAHSRTSLVTFCVRILPGRLPGRHGERLTVAGLFRVCQTDLRHAATPSSSLPACRSAKARRPRPAQSGRGRLVFVASSRQGLDRGVTLGPQDHREGQPEERMSLQPHRPSRSGKPREAAGVDLPRWTDPTRRPPASKVRVRSHHDSAARAELSGMCGRSLCTPRSARNAADTS